MKCLFLLGPYSYTQAAEAKTTRNISFDNLILQFRAGFIVCAQYTLIGNGYQGLYSVILSNYWEKKKQKQPLSFFLVFILSLPNLVKNFMILCKTADILTTQ